MKTDGEGKSGERRDSKKVRFQDDVDAEKNANKGVMEDSRFIPLEKNESIEPQENPGQAFMERFTRANELLASTNPDDRSTAPLLVIIDQAIQIQQGTEGIYSAPDVEYLKRLQIQMAEEMYRLEYQDNFHLARTPPARRSAYSEIIMMLNWNKIEGQRYIEDPNFMPVTKLARFVSDRFARSTTPPSPTVAQLPVRNKSTSLDTGMATTLPLRSKNTSSGGSSATSTTSTTSTTSSKSNNSDNKI